MNTETRRDQLKALRLAIARADDQLRDAMKAEDAAAEQAARALRTDLWDQLDDVLDS